MCSGTPKTTNADRLNSVLARRHDTRGPPATPRSTPRHTPMDKACDEGGVSSNDLLGEAGEKSAVPLTHVSGSGSLSKKKGRRRWPLAVLCAVMIMVSLMGYSILQERIMTRPYVQEVGGEVVRGPEFFRNSLFLVLANRLFAAAVAVLVIVGKGDKEEMRCKAPLSDYVAISLSNVLATSCQYEALKWLTFPTVTIGKCAKMLPVMLILNLRSGRQYGYEDFGIVGVVLGGCAVMISSGNVVAKRTGMAEEDTMFGFGLLIVYLLFDAVTSTYQERLFEKYGMSVYNQMLYMNVSSATISVVGLIVSGGLFESVRFVKRYPRMVPDIVMLLFSAVAGQFAITYTIQSFGALLYAGIMTTRQFCSVLASDIIFKHGLTMVQWTGALMVFSALFYKLWRKALQSGQ